MILLTPLILPEKKIDFLAKQIEEKYDNYNKTIRGRDFTNN